MEYYCIVLLYYTNTFQVLSREITNQTKLLSYIIRNIVDCSICMMSYWFCLQSLPTKHKYIVPKLNYLLLNPMSTTFLLLFFNETILIRYSKNILISEISYELRSCLLFWCFFLAKKRGYTYNNNCECNVYFNYWEICLIVDRKSQIRFCIRQLWQ